MLEDDLVKQNQIYNGKLFPVPLPTLILSWNIALNIFYLDFSLSAMFSRTSIFNLFFLNN